MRTLNINGTSFEVDASDDTPLLWVLRDVLGLMGAKFGCGVAQCGACTVHIDNKPVRSCVIPVGNISKQEVITIEGIGEDEIARKIQQAWIDLDVVQCGYCQPGQIMSAIALLKNKPKPTDVEIDEAMSGNICRCGTYPRIRKAIKKAAGVVEQ